MVDKVTEPAAIAPVSVAVIGTGSVTEGPAPLSTGAMATTASPHQPNLKLIVIAPAMALFIRFVNNYLTTLVGLVGAGLITDLIPAEDFFGLVQQCARLSVAGPAFGFMKDLVTIFGRLESKYPLMTGSV